MLRDLNDMLRELNPNLVQDYNDVSRNVSVRGVAGRL